MEDLKEYVKSAIEDWVRNILIKGILSTAHANRFILNAPLSAQPVKDKLTRRTGRLLSSLGPRGTEESIRVLRWDGDVLNFEWGTRVVYAMIHEKGGVIPVTQKSRNFFWRQFYITGDEKWRYMAISRKSAFQMPPRPFFGVAIEESNERIKNSLKNLLSKILEQISKNLKQFNE